MTDTRSDQEQGFRLQSGCLNGLSQEGSYLRSRIHALLGFLIALVWPLVASADRPPIVTPAGFEDLYGYQIKTKDPAVRERLNRVFHDLKRVDKCSQREEAGSAICRDGGATARAIGISSVVLADEAYVNDRPAEGAAYLGIAESVLDLLVGINPFTGLARDVYEVVTGQNLVTGAALTDLERGMAYVGVLTLGSFSSVKATTRALIKIARRSKRGGNNLDAVVRRHETTILQNREQGRSFEAQVAEYYRGVGFDVVSQVKLVHKSGTETVMDFALWDRKRKRLYLSEAKSGQALLTRNQDLFWTTSVTEWSVRTEKLSAWGVGKGASLSPQVGRRLIGGDVLQDP